MWPSTFLLLSVILLQFTFSVFASNSNVCLNTTQSALVLPKQVVFVHIYKTGGSTMREIFREYGQKCGYSVAVIVHCDKDASLDASKVTDKTVLPCQMKNFFMNDNTMAVRPSVGMVRKRSTLAFTRQFDVIVGHLPHGLFKFVSELKPGEGRNSQKQLALTDTDAGVLGSTTTTITTTTTTRRLPRERILVTWLRHPLSMIISSCLYLINKNQGSKKLGRTSYSDVLDKIRVKMTREENIVSSSGAYSQFIKYLLPGGLAAAAKMKESEIIDFIGNHLKEYAVIGILEHHKVSLQMLKRTVDPTVSLKEAWWDDISNMKRNAVPATTAGSGGGKVAKKAAAAAAAVAARKLAEGGDGNAGEVQAQAIEKPEVISTEAIKKYIESNSTLTAHIENVLRLEYKIYDMALAAHKVQCARLAALYDEIKCAV